MKFRVRELIIIATGLVFSFPTAGQDLAISNSCEYDQEKMLELTEQEFDQDPNGGWRSLTKETECMPVAATLIKKYREHHNTNSRILYWHEGQIRAFIDEYDKAITLFEKARNPDKKEKYGWNLYVDASIAFLKKDRTSLVAAREKLANLPFPEGEPWIDENGEEIEVTADDIDWPPNLSVVDNLIDCFEDPYSIAYATCDND